MKKINFTNEDLLNIYHLYYDQNMSFKDISKLYYCSPSVIQSRFKELKWKGHNKTYKFTKYSVNEHLFDIIDSADKAYCLGLWYADGCNHLDVGDITIELQSQDYSVLEKINEFTENTCPLHFYSSENKKNRKLDTYKLRIHSYYLSNRLNELNFVPRKSLILDFPYWMDETLIPYMLRGYIDGDGWIQKYRIGFMSTDKFCIGVKEYLNSIGIECHIRDMKRHYNKNTKTFDITGRKNIYPLVERMFSDGYIFMKRKLDKYLEFGFLNNIDNSLIA